MAGNQIQIAYYKSPFGELILGSFENELCLCDWRYRKMRNQIDKRLQDALNADFIEKTDTIHKITQDQLNEYFERKRELFDLPLHLVGTDFQKQVWNALIQIPYGKTNSYLTLSQKLNNTKAIRAVASANGANAISIIVPCHRIIGSSGELVGYAGGLSAKQKLLELENSSGLTQLNLF